ncbi:hypothetical protein DH2020_014247 [Rehmannia glutinosa]|uniref:BHLH domain-containing protein n=1 Tax=Rehmannia glutinosa TaxID=99300 RepID=A0ABR0WVY4_REHGL
MNNLNSLLNHGQQQLSSSPHFDPTASNDDFLEQMLSSVPSSASSFTWPDDQPPGLLGYLGEQSAAVLASKMRQHQIGNGASKALMLQQQLLLSRSLTAGNDLRSPTGANNGLLPIPQGDHNDVVDGPSANPAAQNFGSPSAAAAPPMSQPAVSGGAVAGQPRQRVRARRGQATDPHSIAERVRRERIAERMKALQELVPNGNKVLSMSRLGGATAIAPPIADTSSEGRSGNRTQTASSSQNNEGMTVAEQQVAKLMEEDMGSAMQYLQGKGLCLMPISLATAISTATCRTRNPLLNGEAGGPTSPSMSGLTVQSATIGGGAGGGEPSLKDPTSVSKP